MMRRVLYSSNFNCFKNKLEELKNSTGSAREESQKVLFRLKLLSKRRTTMIFRNIKLLSDYTILAKDSMSKESNLRAF
jgi:hypothetical protein